jgi:hypothetical protein
LSCDFEWDDEVDVVCTDSGVGGLATAICAADEDGDVFIADLPAPGYRAPSRPQRSWFSVPTDAATGEYFRELTDDIDVPGLTQPDADLPVRLMGETVPARRRPIPPFEGRNLREWAARCIPSPTGYLYTQVTDWRSPTVDCDGDLYKITEIGSTTPDPTRPIESVREWLMVQARERDLRPQPVTRFDGLVFEEGMVAGAVFSTDRGPMTVRARHGVLICRNRTDAPDPVDGRFASDTVLRVALVGKEASRFGRVELITEDAGIADVVTGPSELTISRS